MHLATDQILERTLGSGNDRHHPHASNATRAEKANGGDPTAFGNQRLIDMRDGLVCFHDKVYAHARQTKVMPLACDAFVRRFLIHTLRNGLVPIRYSEK